MSFGKMKQEILNEKYVKKSKRTGNLRIIKAN